MNSSGKPLVILVLVLLLGGTYYVVKNNEARGNAFEEPQAPVYASETYGFSFSYNEGTLVEFTPRYIAVEDQASPEPNELVQIAVEDPYLPEENTEDFVAFAHRRAASYCAADGPSGSLQCTGATRSDAFLGESGARGIVFYLTMESIRGDEKTEREVGPFYAFDISAQAPGAPRIALFVRPAQFFSSETEMYDRGARVALGVANTLTVGNR